MKKKEVRWWYEREDITPIEIAGLVSYPQVKKVLKHHYKHEWNKAETVFRQIKATKKRKHKDSEEKLVIRIGGSRSREDFDEFYSVATNKYSLSFRKWNEIVNIPIDKETIMHYLYPEIIAHLIYEMTWFGNEKQTQKKGKELYKGIKQFSSPKKKPTK
jgi:hypothetical protein